MPLPPTPAPSQRWPGPSGITIGGDVLGPTDGPPALFLHGVGQTRHAWKGACARVAETGYHAIALDARGHGDSSWAADGDYSPDAMVADLVVVVEALGKPKPVLIGASMGGGVCLVAVGEGHVDAAALVLVDTAPRIDVEGAARVAAFMEARPDGFESLQDVADAIGRYQPGRSRPLSLGGLAKNIRLGDDGRYRWHWDPRVVPRDVDLAAREERLAACARSLTVPTLLVRGGLSDVLTEDGAREFLRLHPGSEYVNVVGAAHMVVGDRNDRFADSVLEFLSRHVPVGLG